MEKKDKEEDAWMRRVVHLKAKDRRKEKRLSVNFTEKEMAVLRGWLESHPTYGSLINLVRIASLSHIRKGGVVFETL